MKTEFCRPDHILSLALENHLMRFFLRVTLWSKHGDDDCYWQRRARVVGYTRPIAPLAFMTLIGENPTSHRCVAGRRTKRSTEMTSRESWSPKWPIAFRFNNVFKSDSIKKGSSQCSSIAWRLTSSCLGKKWKWIFRLKFCLCAANIISTLNIAIIWSTSEGKEQNF